MATDTRSEILTRWRAAKKADPSLTRGEFMMKGSPGHYKNKNSAAAYLRVLESGKRSGSVLWAQSTRTEAGASASDYQVMVKDRSGNARSFDLTVVGGGSTFDVPVVETRLKADRKALVKKQRAWARRYAIDKNDLFIDDITVRRVSRHRKRAEVLSL